MKQRKPALGDFESNRLCGQGAPQPRINSGLGRARRGILDDAKKTEMARPSTPTVRSNAASNLERSIDGQASPRCPGPETNYAVDRGRRNRVQGGRRDAAAESGKEMAVSQERVCDSIIGEED